MDNLGQFHDLYVLTDGLLLADVFKRFRDMTLKYYKLDASHFYTCPGLAWQAALTMSGVCLDLITDPFMYNLIELGTRGGISMVTKKYSRANHKLLKTFDETKPSIHTLTQEIFMAGVCVNHYLMDSYIFYLRMKLKSLTFKKLNQTQTRDIFYKWIWNIQPTCMIYITAIPWHQNINSLKTKTCHSTVNDCGQNSTEKTILELKRKS